MCCLPLCHLLKHLLLWLQLLLRVPFIISLPLRKVVFSHNSPVNCVIFLFFIYITINMQYMLFFFTFVRSYVYCSTSFTISIGSSRFEETFYRFKWFSPTSSYIYSPTFLFKLRIRSYFHVTCNAINSYFYPLSYPFCCAWITKILSLRGWKWSGNSGSLFTRSES